MNLGKLTVIQLLSWLRACLCSLIAGLVFITIDSLPFWWAERSFDRLFITIAAILFLSSIFALGSFATSKYEAHEELVIKLWSIVRNEHPYAASFIASALVPGYSIAVLGTVVPVSICCDVASRWFHCPEPVLNLVDTTAKLTHALLEYSITPIGGWVVLVTIVLAFCKRPFLDWLAMKWNQEAARRDNQQSAFLGLDKLTTLELYRKNDSKALEYSVRMLELAERL